MAGFFKSFFNKITNRADSCAVGRYGFLVLAATLLVSCHDTVEIHYETRVEAEADRLFERGWLPKIIPASSRHIVTKNNVDLNISSGEFFFSERDLTKFLSRLSRRGDLDAGAYAGYSFDGWDFLIDRRKFHCTYDYKPKH